MRSLSDERQSQISILRSLALAFFNCGAYDRAEAVLDELIPCVDASSSSSTQSSGHNRGQKGNHASTSAGGYQELCWLRLAVLKRRKAGEGPLTEGELHILTGGEG